MRLLLAGLALLVGASVTQAANPKIVMETSKGNITIELYEDKAPITVKNFLQYVDDKHFDGLTFHRVIPGFMIQGGGHDVDQRERKTRPIKNESGNGVKNDKGFIAMARTNELDSATSQFFINTVDNPPLDEGQYFAFGKVVEGMDVVEKIKSVETGAKGQFRRDCPLEDVLIKKVTRVAAK